MSLETQSAVMRAGNNEAALKALALSGNMDAIAALKKLLDAKSSRDAAARQAGLQQPETPPVLEQVVGQLGQQEYAAGGRVRSFQAGGTPFRPQRMTPEGLDAYSPPIESSLSTWLEKLLGGAKDVAHAVSDEGITDRVRKPNYSNEGHNYPAPPPTTPMQRTGTATPTPAPATKSATAPRVQSGIAPDMSSGPRKNATPDEVAEGRKLSAEGSAAAPEAKDLPDADLLKQLDALTPLQKEREALRTKSRAQLEAAYNAKVKNLTPSTYDRFMDFMAGVSAKGGSSAAQALGAGALNMHAKDKGRKTEMASVKELYDKSDMLLQEAALADKFGDVEKADKLRKEAATLQKQIAAQKSTEKLQGSQADYYDAQAEYTRSTKPVVEQMKAQAVKDRANRPTGIAAGAKAPDPIKRANLIRQEADAMAKAEGTDINVMTRSAREALDRRATAIVDGRLAKAGTTAVSPAAPKSGFKIIGVE